MAKKWLDKKNKFYVYTGGRYVRQEVSRPRGCVGYRVKEVKEGTKLLICITKKKGKRGGRTKVVSILRDVNKDLRKYRKKGKRAVARAIKKARKLLKKTKS